MEQPNDLSGRLRALAVLVHVYDTIRMLQLECKKSDENINLFEYSDINFKDWSTLEYWNLPQRFYSDDKSGNSYEAYIKQNWKTLDQVADTDANQIAGFITYIPDHLELNLATVQNGLRDAIRMFSGPFANVANIQDAIYSALNEVCQSILSIQTASCKERKSTEYIQLYQSLSLKYNRQQAECERKYCDLIQHMLGTLTHEWYQEKLSEQFTALYHEDLIQKMWDYSSYANTYNIKIPIPLIDVDKRDQKRFYDIYAQICNIQNDHFDYEGLEEKIGRFIYIYKDKLNEADIINIFRYQRMITLIQKDMMELQPVNSKEQHTECPTFIHNSQYATPILDKINHCLKGKSQPKDTMRPICAAIQAGVISRPKFKEFQQSFPNISVSKSVYNDYTNNTNNHYADEAFDVMIQEFEGILQ